MYIFFSVKCARNKSNYFAERLKNAMKGIFSPNKKTLTRIIVWRSEFDLDEIKNIYEQKYRRSLATDIQVKL